MGQPDKISRRDFIKTAALAVTAPLLSSSLAWPSEKQSGPDARIHIGLIGVGMMGQRHLTTFLGFPEVRITAVCDVSRERRENARARINEGYAGGAGLAADKGCEAYVDFRELIARRDIDAVVIATPDHWHAIQAIAACRAGKDVYCEKPLAHTLTEGRAVADAARDHKIVFQTGSQQRTEFGGRFKLACELIRSGRIGRVKTVRAGVGIPPVPCDLPAEAAPAGTDWPMWLGPAPERSFNQILSPIGVHRFYPAWRKYREYGGGSLADIGAHQFDIAQWALGMDRSGPVAVIPPESGEVTGLTFKYANGVEMIQDEDANLGLVFEGAGGELRVERGAIASTPASVAREPLGAGDFRLPNAGTSHARNWLNCIRSRREPVAGAEIGARSAAVCSLANIAYRLRRPLRWDPLRETFAGDDEANALKDYARRKPWGL